MDIEFNKNEDSLKLLVSAMKQRLGKVSEGGGKKAIDKLHEKGKHILSGKTPFKNSELVRCKIN